MSFYSVYIVLRMLFLGTLSMGSCISRERLQQTRDFFLFIFHAEQRFGVLIYYSFKCFKFTLFNYSFQFYLKNNMFYHSFNFDNIIIYLLLYFLPCQGCIFMLELKTTTKQSKTNRGGGFFFYFEETLRKLVCLFYLGCQCKLYQSCQV